MEKEPQAYRWPANALVSATFKQFEKVEEAMDALVDEGFERNAISVLLSDETRARFLEVYPEYREGEGHVLTHTVELEREGKGWKGAGVGGAVGGAVGATAAAIAAAGTTLIIPPLGLVVAGPLAAAFAGAGAGGAAGSLIGALTGAGMDELRAKSVERLVKKGQIVVSVIVHTEPERRLARRELEAHGGELLSAEPED